MDIQDKVSNLRDFTEDKINPIYRILGTNLITLLLTGKTYGLNNSSLMFSDILTGAYSKVWRIIRRTRLLGCVKL